MFSNTRSRVVKKFIAYGNAVWLYGLIQMYKDNFAPNLAVVFVFAAWVFIAMYLTDKAIERAKEEAVEAYKKNRETVKRARRELRERRERRAAEAAEASAEYSSVAETGPEESSSSSSSGCSSGYEDGPPRGPSPEPREQIVPAPSDPLLSKPLLQLEE